jgi:hypothetical protein
VDVARRALVRKIMLLSCYWTLKLLEPKLLTGSLHIFLLIMANTNIEYFNFEKSFFWCRLDRDGKD